MSGRANFTNLSRYSDLCEKTYRRQYQRSFNFIKFNSLLIEQGIGNTVPIILAVDCSFISKSGKHTYGLDNFYHGSASKTEEGLEISAMAVVDVSRNISYSLSVQQTPATKATLVAHQEKETEPETTRINYYLEQLEATVPYLPSSVKHIVTDGFYSKIKWVNGVINLQLHAIGKLRRDANLRYLYQGEYCGRGRPRKYAGKVDFTKQDQLELVTQLDDGVNLYTAIVWSMSLKRLIRLVYIHKNSGSSCGTYALLFSTDLQLDAYSIYIYYKARFQIEFLFRDSKQFTGLEDCQARDLTKLDFHFNSCLTALNLSKLDALEQNDCSGNHRQENVVFSMASYKRRALNHHLLELFINKLGLESTLIKSHPNYQSLYDYGAINA